MSPDQQRGILRRAPATGGSNAGYSSGNGSHHHNNNHMSRSRQRGALVLDAAAAPPLGASGSQGSSVSIASTDSYESTPFQQQQDNLFSRIQRRGYRMQSSNNIHQSLSTASSYISSTASASDANTPIRNGRYTPSPSTRRRDNTTSSSTPNNNMHHTDNGANSPYSAHPNSNTNTNNVGVMEDTAAVIARQAPAAGFLLKMGTNVPNFKRRFFVLHQTTSLYYFLSPDDTNPRGCLDIEGSTLEEVGELSDGRFRFAVCWHDDNDTNNNSGSGSRQKILLEARSRKVGEEWMQSLRQERMSYVKGELTKAQRKNSAYTSRIAELERQVADFKLVETDRDGALEDAARWKDQFEQLDESLRCLTQQLRRQPVDESVDSLLLTPTRKGSSETNQVEKDENELGKDTAGDLDENAATAEKESKESESQGVEVNTSREVSLLDVAVVKEEKAIDVMSIPGVYYSALHNACEQLRENLRLASHEASTAVEDLNTANERVVTVEKRMEKAEKHLGKLWEENCTVRKSLKQRKREKRVLVREVKTLLEEAKLQKRDEIPIHDMTADDSSSRLDGSDEEKMINELEEHVMSSIRLHEELLVTNRIGRPHTKRDFTENLNGAGSSVGGTGPTVRIGFSAQSHTGSSSAANPREAPKDEPPLMSLFDDSESEDDDDDGDDVASASPSLVSSVVAEASDCETNGSVDARVILQSKARPDSSPDNSPERPNPMLQLDEDDDGSEQPNMCAASSQSESSKSVFANKDQATSRLVCPLADVIQTKHSAFDEECQVYHLAFYSRKIGLQFQKVPPPPVRPKGLLTDAMTADLPEEPSGSERTAAELRRVAAISTWAKAEDNKKGTTCKIATPVDAVLVCGFHGFDDSGTNVRPNLGARLIAFDGVSVEVGHWTFDSIRKSIQSRARPLTLSFRNDFLTTEQRTILTKAVKEVDGVLPPPRRHLQYKTSEDRPSSTDPSMQSFETGHFINESDSRGAARAADDDSSVSATSSGNYNYREYALPQSFSGAKSFSSLKSNGNFRSFSEAGSSASSVFSAVAPLVANLLHRRSSDPFTPEYLRRAPESVEDTPQHQDFKAELL
jgi:hypothetical protein